MIENAIHSMSDADIMFLGLDYYGTCSEQGNGPSLIRQALNSFSSYDMKRGVDVFDELRICDAGDIKESNYDKLRRKVLKKLSPEPEAFLITLGGEHLVTLPVIESLKPANVLIFDAHADLHDKYNGQENSYATVAHRISERVDKVLITGVRDLTVTEAGELKKLDNVELVKFEELPDKMGSEPWYVSIDLDVLDPVYCPEVSTPIPLGVSLEFLVKVLNRICLHHRIVGLDIVELTARKKGLSSINAGGIIMNYLRRCRDNG
ncbi:hypothetical protein GF352_03385 [archaeon]|nr:hypothetical protein [archaeon]